MKLNVWISKLVVLGWLFSIQAHASSGPSGNYVLSFGSSNVNGLPATITNKSDSRVQIQLICEDGFQAEGVFTIFCSSGRNAEDPSASTHASVPNIFEEDNEATLSIFDGRNTESFTLKCHQGPDQNNPSNGAKGQ
jgi:hypothetical protein